MSAGSRDAAGTPNEARAILTDLIVGDAEARAAAVRQAPLAGAAALPGLIAPLNSPSPSICLAAAEALRRIALNAGHPGSDGEQEHAVANLMTLLARCRTRAAGAAVLHGLGLIADLAAAAAIRRCSLPPGLEADRQMALDRIGAPQGRRA